MEKERNLYFDFLRGIAIVMVVGIHTTGEHCGYDSMIARLNTMLRQVLNAGVPLFFAISGYFLSKKDLTTRVKLIKFWKHQISKVDFPALLWGIPWLALGVYGSSKPLPYLFYGYAVG